MTKKYEIENVTLQIFAKGQLADVSLDAEAVYFYVEGYCDEFSGKHCLVIEGLTAYSKEYFANLFILCRAFWI